MSAVTMNMLRSVKDLIGYQLKAIDGDIGKCNDFLFDDKQWAVRYLVAKTDGWLTGRKVVISPYNLAELNLGAYDVYIPVKLTKQAIEEAPELEEHAPISRQYERSLAQHYNHPLYWGQSEMWGAFPHPSLGLPLETPEDLEDEGEAIEATHVRSANELLRYGIRATDGEIGNISDFVIECDTWALRYLVVDTGNWLPGKKVLISPAWIGNISWEDKSMAIGMSCEAIKGSPEFDHREPINRDYEGRLHDYYGLPRYWGI